VQKFPSKKSIPRDCCSLKRLGIGILPRPLIAARVDPTLRDQSEGEYICEFHERSCSRQIFWQNAKIFDFDCLSGKEERTDYISYQANRVELTGMHRASPLPRSSVQRDTSHEIGCSTISSK
jgi:hypothetical protein